MNPTIRKVTELDLINSIVIIDEAHNIESISEDAASFKFKFRKLKASQSYLEDQMKESGYNFQPNNQVMHLYYPVTKLFHYFDSIKKRLETRLRQSDSARLNSPQRTNAFSYKDIVEHAKGEEIFHILRQVPDCMIFSLSYLSI